MPGKLPVKYQLITVLLLFIGTLPILALNPAQKPLKSRIEKGIELTLTNNFPEAIMLYQELIDQYPYEAMGYFYKGAALQAQMLDAEDYGQKEEFYQLMRKATRLSDSLLQKRPDDGWLYFYKGSAYLYQSFLKMKEDRWYSAYRDATRGVKNLQKTIEVDSLLYDAYMGIGGYKYWKSARANFLLWLPFISDERKEGIRMISLAIEKGTFVGYVGKDQLVYILIDYGDSESALKIARENHEQHPDSRFLQWSYASAALHEEEWEVSKQLYEDLLHQIRRLAVHNHFNEVDCLVRLAEIASSTGEWEDAFRLSDEALRLPMDPDVRERAKNKLKKALEIRKQAAEKTVQTQITP
jgi:tetratricopeptide (TPR) repeat protein